MLAAGGVSTQVQVITLAIGHPHRLHLLLCPCLAIPNRESGAVSGASQDVSHSSFQWLKG